MSVTGVSSNCNGVEYYKSTASKTKTEESFSSEIQEKPEETLQTEQEEVPGTSGGWKNIPDI